MPRGGARPNSGPKKGSKHKKTIGLVAPPPRAATPEVKLHALSEMRQACLILRNLMAEAHKAYQTGEILNQAKLKAMEFMANCCKDYIRAQREVVPYEDAKLVKLSGDALNPLVMRHEVDLSVLSLEQLQVLRPILAQIEAKRAEPLDLKPERT